LAGLAVSIVPRLENEPCDPLGRLLLHAGDDVRVHVEGEGRGMVAEALRGHFGVDAGGQTGKGRYPNVGE